MNAKHQLRLLGGTQEEVRVALPALVEILSAYLSCVQLAARLSLDGVSSQRGPAPTWLTDVCDSIDVTALKPGSTVLAVEAPPLSKTVPDKFSPTSQLNLLEDRSSSLSESKVALGRSTPLDLLTDEVRSLLAPSTEDKEIDHTLLDAIIKLSDIAFRRFEGLEFSQITGQQPALRIQENDVARLRQLKDETPKPHAARLTGKLDTISHSEPDIKLTLTDGTKVKAVLETHDPNTLQPLWGDTVVVSGIAHYSMKGRLTRIYVERIEPARPSDVLFATLPTPPVSLRVALEQQKEGASTIGDLIGKWPGDETEEELLESLRAIR